MLRLFALGVAARSSCWWIHTTTQLPSYPKPSNPLLQF